MILALFFSFANVVLWHLDYGSNPIDEARTAREKAKLAKKSSE